MLNSFVKIGGSFTNLAKKRFSCRTFDGEGIEEQKLNDIKNIFNKENKKFDFFRAGIVDKKILKQKKFFTTGTYGMFKGDRDYVVGILKYKQPLDWVKYGYLMENIIIFLTEKGFNTCWIGGVFDRRGFGGEIGIKDDERVPAVIPFGYCGKKRTLRDKIVRWSAQGDKRKPFEKLFFIEEDDNSINKNLIKSILENVRIAPSASNKQPWRIFYRNKRFDLYLKRDKLYSKLIPSSDLQMIDMGIAAYHLEQSAMEKGFKGKWVKEKNLEKDNLEYILSFYI